MRYDQKGIGDRLKIARKTKNLLQSDICKEIGMDQSTYSKLENGKYDVQLSVIYMLCDYLDISIAWLLGLNNDENFTSKELYEINEYKKFVIFRRKN